MLLLYTVVYAVVLRMF